MKRFMLKEPHFIGGALLAAGSIVTEGDLGKDRKGHKTKPGEGLVEINAHGQAVDRDEADEVQRLGVSAIPVEVAPVSPHAPNPTMPQALPAHNVGEVLPAGTFVPAQGVESDEAAEARAEQVAETKPQRR